jgi:exosortase E/protease (VPEID-CTERM system)
LVVEVVAVSLPNWWPKLVGEGRYALQVVLTVCLTTAIFAGDRLRQEAAVLGRALHRSVFPWRLMACQLGAYTVFAVLTPLLVAYRAWESAYAAVWLGIWAVAGLAAAGLWCAVLFPPRAWWHFARRVRGELGLAVAVGVVAWFSARYSEELWGSLADVTLTAVAVVLRVAFDEVLIDTTARVVGTPGYAVQIGHVCSGYEGFGLVAAVIGSYLWLARASLRFPAALLLLPLGVVASWVLNVFRITALLSIGACGWTRVAGGGFHTHAGWLAFNVVALGVIALSWYLPAFRRDPRPARQTPRGPNPAPALLLPLMAVVATAMVTGAISEDGFDRFYPVRVVAAGAVLWAYRGEYTRLGWGWSWAAAGIGLLVFAAWIGLDRVFPPDAAAGHEGGKFLTYMWWEKGLWVGARILGAVVTVPLVEELAFRGYLLRRLRGDDLSAPPVRRWSWFAVVASAIVFGILHPGHWVAGVAAGVAYAWAYHRRGRLGDAVLAHAVTNGALAAYVLATGNWSLW